MTTEQYRVVSVAVRSGDCMDGGLEMRVLPDLDDPSAAVDTLSLQDDRGACRLLLDGQPVNRAVLLAWLPTTRAPRVEVDRDYEHGYGHVAEARFSG